MLVHSHNGCFLFPPAHLAGRTNYRFYDGDDVLVSLLETLLGYRRWQVQPLYPSLLEDLAGVTLVDSKEFPLH